MSNYLEQIEQLVQELEHHPKIIVHVYQTFPPIDTSTLETIEKRLGHRLNSDLTTFFTTTNGLRLSWRFCIDTSTFPKSIHHFDDCDGYIFIPSLEEIFNHNDLLIDDYLINHVIQLKLESTIYKVALNPANELGQDILSDFDTFLQRLIHSKGLITERKHIFNHNYQTSQNILEKAAISQLFNQSNHEGADTSKLQTALMQQHAEQSKTISQQELNAILEAHHQFLANGGAGGRWSTYEVGGFVFGIYLGKSSKEGLQANLEKRNLSSNHLDTCELQLPFTTFCGVYGKYQDFSDADFSYCLFTDANLEKAIFADANLMYTDFSRANLRDVSFMNANLTGCDFENCDLTGADFRGATWKGAKFPGAILKGIRY